MRGCEALTTDDRTRITWVLGAPRDARKAPIHRAATGIEEGSEALRSRLITATVELASEGSNPRLMKSRNAPIAP